VQYFRVKCMHSYLVWKHRSHPFFSFLWTPFFLCELVHVFEIVCLNQDWFLMLPLGKKSPTFVSCEGLSYSTKYIIWHCFLSCFCRCFNYLFFYLKGLFLVVFQHLNLFQKRKPLKDLVLFMKTKTFNVCIKIVP
jgi:hypothetical protein